jgi:hypothetical protein
LCRIGRDDIFAVPTQDNTRTRISPGGVSCRLSLRIGWDRVNVRSSRVSMSDRLGFSDNRCSISGCQSAAGWCTPRDNGDVGASVGVVEGVGPALLQCGQEALFDFVGDVGIDLLDFVGELCGPGAGIDRLRGRRRRSSRFCGRGVNCGRSGRCRSAADRRGCTPYRGYRRRPGAERGGRSCCGGGVRRRC